MVYNNLNYPNLIALFDELGVEGIETSMGFSVSMDNGAFEWCGETVAGLLATPSNIVNPAFYAMFNDIFRFNKKALAALELPENHKSRFQTTREFLHSNRFSESFAKYYLIPLAGAIWSATSDDILNFPAITLFSFLRK
jgi:predicted NAD/FAD-binding protein